MNAFECKYVVRYYLHFSLEFNFHSVCYSCGKTCSLLQCNAIIYVHISEFTVQVFQSTVIQQSQDINKLNQVMYGCMCYCSLILFIQNHDWYWENNLIKSPYQLH